jgi:hypothetical protein
MSGAKQVKTKLTTTAKIMSSPAFGVGFNDARTGIPFDWRKGADTAGTNGAWDYERGRLFAHIAPITMLLYINSELNPEAVSLFDAASDRKLIG